MPLRVKLFMLLLLPVTLLSCSSWGSKPTEQQKERYAQSPNYRVSEERFVNRNQSEVDAMWDTVWNVENFWKFFTNDAETKPPAPLPEVKPDFSQLQESHDDLNVIWFGHSSFLLDISDKLVLVDPLFGNAGPFPFLGRRFQKPVVTAKELPEVDVILISHDHYDHLETKTMRFYAEKDVVFVVPLGIGRLLIEWGIDPKRVTELDWWQSADIADLKFTAAPSQHYSGRRGFANNDTLWASWVVKSDKHNVYFSGDSAYDTHFAKIGERFGPFDIAFLENGQFSPVSRQVHMFPEDAVQAFEDLNAKKLFPVHWGMFSLASHDWNKPIRDIDRMASDKGIELVAPRIGELLNVDKPYFLERWWEAVRPGG
ncbi:MAG: MBL fold metallo-hydrolase [Sneathiellales bacterium]|nr:MBL fold metallo-hydrolase [Sneathiellales bacterium]